MRPRFSYWLHYSLAVRKQITRLTFLDPRVLMCRTRLIPALVISVGYHKSKNEAKSASVIQISGHRPVLATVSTALVLQSGCQSPGRHETLRLGESLDFSGRTMHTVQGNTHADELLVPRTVFT